MNGSKRLRSCLHHLSPPPPLWGREREGHDNNRVTFSSSVDPQGGVTGWHDFGIREGPGWASKAVGSAREIYRLGQVLKK
ncbi:MAG: hypothetical protein NZT92_16360 [Abditibacteriales bacterium]|nr:hypothetical protein [Abditibacteriales bacterium]MDW8367492.1 hypothetical protein [Abditibacteriales bacterium]